MSEPVLAPRATPSHRALVAVGLNEAGLDSPTFRATVVHISEQFDAIEKWLDGYAKATAKIATEMLAVEDSVNSYLSKIIPGPPATDTFVLDADYTYLALRHVGEGSREWWKQILSPMKKLETMAVDPIRSYLNSDIRAFKEVRKGLEQAQKTYDTTLARYVSQSKAKEPSALREDAFAVYEARKAYLKASMDYCQLAPQMRFALDKILIRICSGLWSEMKKAGESAAFMSTSASEMQRIRGWAKEMGSSEMIFKQELQLARREVGEGTLQLIRPSRELDYYSTSTVPFLGGPSNVRRTGDNKIAVISEKQGWLFLRTLSGKPVRTSWIRRWYYCRDGIFGWLVQGSQGVFQGDEIGVLLCNAKPAVSEDRRFCFEVKTGIQTMMLQAETQAELTEWLEVFDVSRELAFEASEARSVLSPGQQDPAFSITPSIIPEFSARLLDTQLNPSDEMTATVAAAAVAAAERSNPLSVSLSPETGRPSFDPNGAGTRRALAALGRDLAREEGESGREHASRIMHRLDLHRKNLPGSLSSTDAAGSPGLGPAGGISSLVSSGHNLIPSSNPGPLTIQTGQGVLGASLFSAEANLGNLTPPTFARPPIPTSLSRLAISAVGEQGFDKARNIPSSLMANYWGSNIWGSIYPSNKEVAKSSAIATSDGDDGDDEENPVGVVQEEGQDKKNDKNLTSRHAAETFPPNYPVELKAQHAQFRVLFPKASRDEKLVLVFRAAWAKSATSSVEGNKSNSGSTNNATLAFSNGRVFVTPDNMYFYGNHLGLVSVQSTSLDAITQITAKHGPDCDHIYLHLRKTELGDNVGDLDSALSPVTMTIKTFLDDLDLLHSRLNLLVDDLQSEEPMELQEIIGALTNLEREETSKQSPSAESWEEVSVSTPFDEGPNVGPNVGRKPRPMELSPKVIKPRLKHVPKVQPPTQPVMYEPEDMPEVATQRNFEISAKACFHVLFGDKSFVFPKLYFERRAQQIAQGPWQSSSEKGTMARVFKFSVDRANLLGKPTPADIVDTQSIDIFSDHVTYAVTHVKTAWHLPYSQAFRVVSKIIITHVAKSKCKLAIYVKVEWSNPPPFSRWLVEQQALTDAKNDAEELAEVATDQVRKLGQHSRTKRAIQVYGHIGQQMQVVVFSPAEPKRNTKKQAVKVRSLTAMVFDTVRSFTESCVTSVIMWIFAALRKVFSVVTANWLILTCLGLSLVLNLMLTSMESSTWWAERRATQFMDRLGVGPNMIMSKAVYVADMDKISGVAQPWPATGKRNSRAGAAASTARILEEGDDDEDSVCFTTFQAILNSTDLDAPYQAADIDLTWPTSKSIARRLRRTRQRMATYRHDLLVAMRIVNSVEREMLQSQWENWLADENMRCEQLLLMLDGPNSKNYNRMQDDNRQGGDTKQQPRAELLRRWHDGHCGSCKRDAQALAAVGRNGF